MTGMAAGLGFEILGLDYSPIRGPEGNIEYLMYLRKPAADAAASAPAVSEETIRALVEASHSELEKN